MYIKVLKKLKIKYKNKKIMVQVDQKYKTPKKIISHEGMPMWTIYTLYFMMLMRTQIPFLKWFLLNIIEKKSLFGRLGF